MGVALFGIVSGKLVGKLVTKPVGKLADAELAANSFRELDVRDAIRFPAPY